MTTLERSPHLLEAQAKLSTIQIIQSAELKEYEAPWLEKAKTVTRNGSGQFASKTKASEQAIATGLGNSEELKKGFSTLLEEGTTNLKNVVSESFGSGAKQWRLDAGNHFANLTTGLKEAITGSKSGTLNKQAESFAQELELLKGQALDSKTQKTLAERATNLYIAAQKKYHDAITKIESINPTVGNIVKVLGEIAAASIPIALMWSAIGAGVSAGTIGAALLSPFGQAIVEMGGGVGNVFLKSLPPIIARAVENAVAIATADKFVQLDRQRRGVSKESLETESFLKKRLEEARAILIFVGAAGGMAVALGALNRALMTKIRKPSALTIQQAKELLDTFETKLTEKSTDLGKKAKDAFVDIWEKIAILEQASQTST